MDLALNNLQGLICHKTKPNRTNFLNFVNNSQDILLRNEPFSSSLLQLLWNQTRKGRKYSALHSYFSHQFFKKKIRECPCGFITNKVDFDVVITKFGLSSRYYVHFHTNAPRKSIVTPRLLIDVFFTMAPIRYFLPHSSKGFTCVVLLDKFQSEAHRKLTVGRSDEHKKHRLFVWYQVYFLVLF